MNSNNKITTIDTRKILELNDENHRVSNDVAQIISINVSEFEEAMYKIGKVKAEKFKNVFIYCIETDQIPTDDEIVNEVNFKLAKIYNNDSKELKRRIILAQIVCKNQIFNYIKHKNNIKFEPLPTDRKVSGGKFTYKDFLSIQNCAITKISFEYLLYKYPTEPKIFFFQEAINSRDELNYRLLKLFNVKLEPKESLFLLELIMSLESCDSMIHDSFLLADFNTFDIKNISKNSISEYLEFHSPAPTNLFEFFVENNYIKGLEIIKIENYTSHFENILTVDVIEKSLKTCNEKYMYEFIDALTKMEFEHFNELQHSKLSIVKKNGEEIVRDVDNFLFNIENFKTKDKSHIDKIRQFIDNNKQYYYYNQFQKKCALQLALKMKNIEAYSVLLSVGFSPRNQNEINQLIEDLDDNLKVEICEENKKNSSKDPYVWINFLLIKCEFFNKEKHEHVDLDTLLHKIKDNPDLIPILKVAAQEKPLEIFFDCSSDRIKKFNPKSKKDYKAVTDYKSSKIYISNSKDKTDLLGIFVHEITHQVLYLIYDNNCLPYCKGDLKREMEWKNVFENTLNVVDDNNDPLLNEKEIDQIILNSFNNYKNENDRLLELAVRAPNIIAKYFEGEGNHKTNPKLQKLQEQFPDLFSFHREKILKDLNIPNIYRLISINNEFGLIKGIEESKLKMKPKEELEILNSKEPKIILKSTIPQLTLSQIYNETKNPVCYKKPIINGFHVDIEDDSDNKLNYKIRNIFIDINKLSQIVIRANIYEILEKSMVERVIVEVYDFENKDFKEMCSKKSKVQIIIVTNTETKVTDFTDYKEVSHKWDDLMDETKDFIKARNIIFSGENCNIFNLLEKIPENVLPFLCSNDEIKINIFNEDFNISGKSYYRNITKCHEGGTKRLSSKQFIKSTMKDQIILISSHAGIGKSHFMRTVLNILVKKKIYWVSYISLLHKFECLKQLDLKNNNFIETITQIFDFNALEKVILYEKFLKGKVKIFFDGFDEISPDLKTNMIEIFKLFNQQEGGRLKKQKKSNNQLWVSSRVHLENEIENVGNVCKYHLETLNYKEEKALLKEIYINLNKNKDPRLTEKIHEFITFSSDMYLTGLPLVINKIDHYFKNEIFKNKKKEDEIITILNIYKKVMIDVNFDIWNGRFKKDNHLENNTLKGVHFNIAVSNYFGKEKTEILRIGYDRQTWTNEEIARGGLVHYYEQSDLKFNNKIYAQTMLALFITETIVSQEPIDCFKEILDDIAKNKRHKIARKLLFTALEDQKVKKQTKYESMLKEFEQVVKSSEYSRSKGVKKC